MLNYKRSQSQIVSTVLLILIVITAIVLIFSFVIPFVKDKLSEGDCLDVAGKVEISTGYTCHNGSAMQVQVYIADIEEIIEGFSIELGGPSSKTIKIEESNGISGVKMCNQSAVIYLPGNNEERTYVFENVNKPTLVRVYPILKGGKVCSSSDTTTTIDDCFMNECPPN